jgi:hypothetical protein
MTSAFVQSVLSLKVDQGDQYIPTFRCKPSEALAREQELLTELAEVMLQIEAMNAVYREHRWTRYFPCTNADGHIHSSLTGCPSVRITTGMAWTPSLSGKTVEEAVKELGPLLCSICFPSAPVEWCRSKSELNAKPVCEGSGKSPEQASVKRRGMRANGECQACSYHGQLTSYGLTRKHQPTQEA